MEIQGTTFRNHKINKIDTNLYEIEAQGSMRVPGRIFASPGMMQHLLHEAEPLQQVINVARLPGLVGYSLAMPDIHWGYGFPIGGVAATDWQDGVISPGGVGYDINCGVRLASTALPADQVKKRLPKLISALFQGIPSGIGSSGAIRKLSIRELKGLTEQGVGWIISQGYGSSEEIDLIEERGQMPGADSSAVSSRALERGQNQMGTLGSGNHFLEIDMVDHIFDPATAEEFGLHKEQVVVLIHTGSRGLGYQICDDYLRIMGRAVAKYKIDLPDRQLACAPVQSAEGREYLSAMACAANYAWCNRQVIMDLARRIFKQVFAIADRDLRFRLIYDVSHNIAKKETHSINGQKQTLCVHRKGATRAFPANRPEVPQSLKSVGHPVLIPGDMGRYSFVCVATPAALDRTFGSTCHGAGRLMSRKRAKKANLGRNLLKEMALRGVLVQARGKATVAEEMPESYKDVSEVVNIMESAGISRKVVRLKPLAVIKG